MASKSAQQEPEKAEVIEEALDVLDKALDRVKVLYEQYFLGIQKQAPTYLHTDVERKMRDLSLMQIRNTALRYRLTTLQQKYGAYSTYWRRTLKQIENGTYVRNLSKIGRKAARTGEAVPAEILAAMPKRMREQVVRDREVALAIARRRDHEFEDEVGTTPFLSEDMIAMISEPTDLRRNLRRQGNTHLLDPDDIDIDLNEFFAEVERQTPAPDAPEVPDPGVSVTFKSGGTRALGEAARPRSDSDGRPAFVTDTPSAANRRPDARSVLETAATVWGDASARPDPRGAVPRVVPLASDEAADSDERRAVVEPEDPVLERRAAPRGPIGAEPSGGVPRAPVRAEPSSRVASPIATERSSGVAGPRAPVAPEPSGGVPRAPVAPERSGRVGSPIATERSSGVAGPRAPVAPEPSGVPRAPVAAEQSGRVAPSVEQSTGVASARRPDEPAQPGARRAIPAIPPIPKLPAIPPIGVAPSQLTKPNPIAPGAAAARAATPVETMAGPFPRMPAAPQPVAREKTEPGLAPTRLAARAGTPLDAGAPRAPQRADSLPAPEGLRAPAPPIGEAPRVDPTPVRAPARAPTPAAPPAKPIGESPGVDPTPRAPARAAQPAPASSRPPAPDSDDAGWSWPDAESTAPRVEPMRPPDPARRPAEPAAPPATRPAQPQPARPTPQPARKPRPAADAPRLSPPPGMTDADVNALFANYVKAKEMVGESAGPGSYGKLLKTINAQAPKIMQQYNAKGVDFSIVVKDNQVIIRAKPKT